MRTPELEKYLQPLKKALARAGDTYTVDEVDTMIAEHDAQLWTAPRSFIITQVMLRPRKKILHVWLAGGKLEEITAMSPRIVAWAKEEGCSGASMIGRPGWERTFLAQTGWKRTAVLMEAEWDTQA